MSKTEDGVVVREARADEHELVYRTFLEVLSEVGARKRPDFRAWQWEYTTPGRDSLIIAANVGDRLGGYTHILYPRINIGGGKGVASLIQDVGTTAVSRGKGLFPRIGSFLLDQARGRGADFAMGWPNDRALPGWLKYHQFTVIKLVPIRVRVLRPAAALLQRLRGIEAPASPPITQRRHKTQMVVKPLERFDAETEEVANEFAQQTRVGIERSASYLNWRYFEKPNGGYRVAGAWQGNRLASYVVTKRAELFGVNCELIMDLACRTGAEVVLRQLLQDRMADARATGAAAAVTVGLHPFFAGFPRLGFITVPEKVNPHPFRLMIKPLTERGERYAMDPDNWLITLGDYDVF